MMGYGLMAPEILIALGGIAILSLGLANPRGAHRITAAFAWVILALALVLVIPGFTNPQVFFDGVYRIDNFASFFRILFLGAALLVLAMVGRYSEYFGRRRNEWFTFMLFATLGMVIMASAGDMLILYVGLELMTVSFYILSAYLLNDSRSAEAGLKYLILGALSSAVLLMGMSLVYAAAGTTVFADIYRSLIAAGSTQPVLVAGIVLLISGMGFKIAAVPFHMWTPDIYEGAPTPVTAFLAVASKAAGFAAMIRVFMGALPLARFDWTICLAALAALTMIIGNLIALVQDNVKRLLAYSSIAQAGYILSGLVAANHYGLQGMLFYALVYVFANVGAFTVTILVETDRNRTDREAFCGLGQRSPMLAAIMTVCLLSLAGIPPMAGFAGKFYLFAGAVQAGYLWLAGLGLLMSMISVYYYLSIAKNMYAVGSDDPTQMPVPVLARVTLWICLLGTILLGIYPAPLANSASQAILMFL